MSESSAYKFLWKLRIGSFMILLFAIYFTFSEIEFVPLINFSLPLCYQGIDQIGNPWVYQPKKIFVVVLPIVFNIALWCLRYETYVFIRIVVIMELCKVIIPALIGCYYLYLALIQVAAIGYGIVGLVTITYFILLIKIYKIISKKPEFRMLFYQEDEVKGQDNKRTLTINMTIILYTIMVIFYIVETHYQESKFLPEQHIEKYYLEGHSQDSYAGRRNLCFSSDGKFFANVFSEGEKKGNVGIFNSQTGKQVKLIADKISIYGVFYVDNDFIIIDNLKEKENREVFEVWNMKSGKKEREFYATKELWSYGRSEFYINSIDFSDDHKYISSEGRGIAVWNYQDGKLIDFYNDYADKKSLAWLSDKTYIVTEILDSVDKNRNINVHLGKVSDHEIVKEERFEMTKDLQKKAESLDRIDIKVKRGTEEGVAAVMISGELAHELIWQKGYVDIWNVKEEKKLFSLESYYKIIDVAFYEDGKRVLIFEKMHWNKMRITVWNIEENKKEKSFYVYDTGDYFDMEFFEKEKKIIELRNPMTVIGL